MCTTLRAMVLEISENKNSSSNNNSKNNNNLWPEHHFHFSNVEEGPLLGTFQASILALVAFCTLVLGLGVNFRIFTMLWKRKSSGGSAAIDKLFLANNIVSLLGHPPLLVRIFQIFFLPENQLCQCLTFLVAV